MDLNQLTEAVKTAVQAELTPLKQRLDALEKAPATSNTAGLTAQPGARIAHERASRIRAVEERDDLKGKGLNFARCIRAQALAQLNPAYFGLDAAKAAEFLGYTDIAQAMYEVQQKAMGEGTLAGGGALVPETYAADFIEVLRPNTVVRSMDPLTITLENDNMMFPRGTTPTSASYVGENAAVAPVDMQFGNVRLSAKKLAAISVISNDLIRNSDPAVDVIVRRDLMRSVALAEDLAFLRNPGSDFSPKGIASWMNPGNKLNQTQAGGVATLSEVTTNLMQLQGKLEDNNVPLIPERCAWIMHPRAKRFLETLRDGVGNYVFRDEIVERGTLMGFKLKTTTQIPTNLGGGADQSEVYFGSFDEVLIGDALVMEGVVLPNGAYDNGSGTVISGFSNDQTAIRIISKHDFMLRHDVSFALLQQVQWTA